MGNHKLEKLKSAYKAEHYADPHIRIGYDSRRFSVDTKGAQIRFSAEASDLEIPVGIIPKRFEIDGVVTTGPFVLVNTTEDVWQYEVPNTLIKATTYND